MKSISKFITIFFIALAGCTDDSEYDKTWLLTEDALNQKHGCYPRFQNTSRFISKEQLLPKTWTAQCTTIDDFVSEQTGSYVFVTLNKDLVPQISTNAQNDVPDSINLNDFDQIILTGGADQFWNSGCADFTCYSEAAHGIQKRFSDYILENELDAEKILYVENIKSQNTERSNSSRNETFAQQAILIAVYERLGMKFEGSHLIGIVNSERDVVRELIDTYNETKSPRDFSALRSVFRW